MKKMINSRIFIWSLVGFLFIQVSCGNQESSDSTSEGDTVESSESNDLLSKINKSGKLVVGFEPDAPPLYIDKTGFDYDLISYLSKEVFDGVEIQPYEDGYDNLPQTLSEGKIDLMAGGRTNENKSDELYSDSYLSFGYCLVTSGSSAKKFKDLSSLTNAKIGVYDDFASDWVKTKLPSANISIIGSREDENTATSEWMNGLLNAEFDAIIYDYPFAANEIEDYQGKIVITNTNLNGDQLSEYVLVLNKRTEGAAELMSKINDAIAKYKQLPQYADAVVKHIPSVGLPAQKQISSSQGYTIKKGETLSIIARDQLGDVNLWRELYQINKSILASPDIIYPGQILTMPAK